jgi:hypothetical protein
MFCAPGRGFRGYRGRRVLFSIFVFSDPYIVVSSASGLVLMFCAPKPIFSVINGFGSHFHVLRSRTLFRRYRGRRFRFHVLRTRTSFRRYRRRQVLFFMFCAPGPVFGGTDCVGSRFRRYRRRLVPLSCFALPDPFLTVPRASGPVFMFCAPRLDFGGTEGVEFRFHFSRSRTRFRRYRGR